ncbi:expressed unknown protein [Seminavis robusta]|uniref:Uncharacterized protein n=1 Tax=Seminavis robusta TaxID=568900 RepID=A0A9N8E7Y2_9STRA|nr:expressed unknown protein [Seminavis robusta]|eukprot:Sro592_g172200.1 n/a (176) ;mRNA; r:51312-51839
MATTTTSSPALQSYFANLFAGATILGDVEIVSDNARLPPQSETKTPVPTTLPDISFACRWESNSVVPKPSLPQRQISIELPFSDDSDDDSDDEDTVTDLSWSLGSSNHSNSSGEQHASALMTTRWMPNAKFSASPKRPERSPIVKSDSCGSVSSSSTSKSLLSSPVKKMSSRRRN